MKPSDEMTIAGGERREAAELAEDEPPPVILFHERVDQGVKQAEEDVFPRRVDPPATDFQDDDFGRLDHGIAVSKHGEIEGEDRRGDDRAERDAEFDPLRVRRAERGAAALDREHPEEREGELERLHRAENGELQLGRQHVGLEEVEPGDNRREDQRDENRDEVARARRRAAWRWRRERRWSRVGHRQFRRVCGGFN
jgi:hypothetical protein